MKPSLPKIQLTGTLLVAYAVYSTFVPVSIAHSIIIFSLALLYGYEKFLVTTKSPSITQMVQDLRKEILQQLEQQKELTDVKIQQIEGEISRQAIAKVNTSPSSKKPPIQF